MPLVKISIIEGRTEKEKAFLTDAIHSALVDTLKIPRDDKNQRIYEYSKSNFQRPPGKTDKYTLIEIIMFPGRSKETKRKLYQSIVKNVSRLGIDPMDLFIVLQEPPMENWGIRGGIPADEVDLGFKTSI